ncbi:MAG: V-type ATP synthase subunit E [Desulfurococcus sp.]|nr:V-type ATP synthase subunit E [Desulfurococcus sp.]
MPESVEDVKTRLLQEAEERARRIVEDAKAEAERILRSAEEKWKARAEEEKRRILGKAEREAGIILSEAVRDARLLVASEMEKILREIIEEARSIVRNRGFSVEDSLRNLIAESLRLADSPRRIVVSRVDFEVAKKIVSEAGLKNVVVEPGDIDGGVIVESASGVVVDNTYESRLREFQKKNLNSLRRILWG